MLPTPDVWPFTYEAMTCSPWPTVVAGGCLRDMVFDKPITDIDVFVQVYPNTFTSIKDTGFFTVNTADGFIKAVYASFASVGNLVKYKVQGEDFYDSTKFLSGRSDDAPGMNVILMPLPTEYAKTQEEEVERLVDQLFKEFPASISRIAYSPLTQKVYKHESFEQTEVDRVIVFDPACDFKYKDKILKKYRGWKYTTNFLSSRFLTLGGGAI